MMVMWAVIFKLEMTTFPRTPDRSALPCWSLHRQLQFDSSDFQVHFVQGAVVHIAPRSSCGSGYWLSLKTWYRDSLLALLPKQGCCVLIGGRKGAFIPV